MTTATSSDLTLVGLHGPLLVRQWLNVAEPGFVALVAHGLGEHSGRYAHVAARLTDLGAAVYAPDHLGHGRSAGQPASLCYIEDMVTDLHTVALQARAEHGPNLPQVLVGHSMGGIIATRYAQRYGSELTALVLSAPGIGGNPAFSALLALDPLPDVPIDPAALSRDPDVGVAYATDPLVYHVALQRESLLAIDSIVSSVADGGSLGELPTLWLHGTDDQLAPLDATRPAIERIRGARFAERIYPGARHELFNEIDKDAILDDVIAFLSETRNFAITQH